MLEKQDNGREFTDNIPHANCRTTVIEWVKNICEKANYNGETVHLAVNLVDNFLVSTRENPIVGEENYHRVVAACVSIASKYLECQNKTNFLKLCNILEMDLKIVIQSEESVFTQLKGNLNIITPKHFLRFFITRGVVEQTDMILKTSSYIREGTKDVLRWTRKWAEAYVDLAIEDYKFYGAKSHLIASAALALARLSIGIFPLWTDGLSIMTQSNWDDFFPICDALFPIFENSKPDLCKGMMGNKAIFDEGNMDNFMTFEEMENIEKIQNNYGQGGLLQRTEGIEFVSNVGLQRTDCK